MFGIGIIGCGKIAQVRHIPEYAENKDAKLLGFYDINQERAAALAEKQIQENKALAESCIDKDIKELYELIGKPNSSEYAPSCLVNGEDGVLYYDGFVVYTTREGDVENVYYVE